MTAGLPVAILAGGRSERFGADKARAELLGRPLIRHVVDVVQPLSSSLAVVARRDDQYADLGLTTVGDRRPDLGPLGGVHTALKRLAQTDEPWLLVAPCDLWGLDPGWLGRLADARGPDVTAVAFRDAVRWQPLPMMAHRDLLPLVERQIRRHERSLFRLLDRAAHRALPLPRRWCRAIQVNSPADLARAERTLLADG